MSCNYAEGLSPYGHKGKLGAPEKFDSAEKIEEKCAALAELLRKSKHVVVHTGAGISTSAGIPDFRGPKGVWTLEAKGEKPKVNVSFNNAVPTKTHMAIKALIERGFIHYVISQNIDGLHLKSGLQREYIAELHGNMFIEECNKCKRQFVRKNEVTTVGQKPCGGVCRSSMITQRPCRNGLLLDNILDWEADLPERDLEMAFMNSSLADLNLALGSTLQIIPSGTMPLKNKKFGGKLVICNLQPTKYDKKADLVISTYVDDIFVKLCNLLQVEIPEYNTLMDPTKSANAEILEWTLSLQQLQKLEKKYNQKLKKHNELRKVKRNNFNFIKTEQEFSKDKKIKTENYLE